MAEAVECRITNNPASRRGFSTVRVVVVLLLRGGSGHPLGHERVMGCYESTEPYVGGAERLLEERVVFVICF